MKQNDAEPVTKHHHHHRYIDYAHHHTHPSDDHDPTGRHQTNNAFGEWSALFGDACTCMIDQRD